MGHKGENSLPKLTVIIPCYNCVDTLKATVDSIRACKIADCELLLIDDGSTDGTSELCDGLSREYAAVRCIHQANAGVSAARNRGIDEAAGEYIWFVDADDTVDALSAARAVNIAFARQVDMLIFGVSFDYYHRGKLYRSEKLVPPHEGEYRLDELVCDFRELYGSNSLSSACTKLFCRKTIKDNSIRFRKGMTIMEDFMFVLDTLPHCASIYCLSDAVYRYKQAEDKMSAYRRLKKVADLAEYVQPIERGIKALNVPCADELTDEFYTMLLRQKMYYAPLSDIKNTVRIHESGIRAGMGLQLDPMRIYLANLKGRIRHKVAVAVKSAGIYRPQA